MSGSCDLHMTHEWADGHGRGTHWWYGARLDSRILMQAGTFIGERPSPTRLSSSAPVSKSMLDANSNPLSLGPLLLRRGVPDCAATHATHPSSYFDSGYYFGADSGDPIGVPFQTPLSGLTHHERTADGYEYISAYRAHNVDLLSMIDGGKLTWQVGAGHGKGTTKCGNPIAGANGDVSAARIEDMEPPALTRELHQIGDQGAATRRVLSAVNVTSYAWVYEWSASPTT